MMDAAEARGSGPPDRGHPVSAASDGETLARLIAEGRIAPDVAVTCCDRFDGAGAQARGIISAMVLARFAGCRYVHTPFTTVDHAIGAGRTVWARRWEQFFNLGDGETPIPDDAELVRLAALVRDPDAYAGRRIVIGECLFGLAKHKAVPIRDALRDELRAKYWRSPKASIRSHRAARGFTAAVHLRRGDVTAARHPALHVPHDVALRQVLRLRAALAAFGQRATINFYSEGAPDDFRAFAAAGCTLHIGEDPFETFHNMVTADILMAWRSSFSEIAALLSRSVVLHRDAEPSKLSNHLRRHPNGDIRINRLRRALIDRMSWPQRLIHRARRCLRAGWRMSVRSLPGQSTAD
jgi:hypothetical protein